MLHVEVRKWDHNSSHAISLMILLKRSPRASETKFGVFHFGLIPERGEKKNKIDSLIKIVEKKKIKRRLPPNW